MEKLTKQDVKGPDAFQSSFEVVSDYFFRHRMTIIVGVIVLLVVGVIWAAVGVYGAGVEEKAQEALFFAEKKLDATNEAFEKAKAPVEKPTVTKDKKKDKAAEEAAAKTAVEVAKLPKPTGDLEADYKDSLPLLRAVVKDFPHNQAAVLATLDLTKIYQDHKLYEPQIALLENASKTAHHPVTKALTLNQLALAYEGKGDCSKAIETWQRIENNKALSFMAGRSLLNMGLCYEKLHQNDKAEQAYLKAEGLVKDGETGKTAKKYLRLLKREQKT